MKKNILYILLSISLGVYLSNYIFSSYKKEVKYVNKELKEIYLYQYEAYNNKEVMLENTKVLKNYFYYKKDNLYHVIIAISQNKDLSEKLKKAYNIQSNIYVKKEKIINNEFITNLNEYDKLIKKTDDENVIINAEKQIMAKYKELILDND